jgi:hypothetical protein
MTMMIVWTTRLGTVSRLLIIDLTMRYLMTDVAMLGRIGTWLSIWNQLRIPLFWHLQREDVALERFPSFAVRLTWWDVHLDQRMPPGFVMPLSTAVSLRLIWNSFVLLLPCTCSVTFARRWVSHFLLGSMFDLSRRL